MYIHGMSAGYLKAYGIEKPERNMTEHSFVFQKNDVRYDMQKYSGIKSPDTAQISEEGRNMLREMTSIFESESNQINARELTIQNTNEVAWEHYTAMRGISGQTLKNGNYDVEDVMKSIMDTYEDRYDEIMKEHENGDREVSYELTGKRALTLDEDLAGLDEAFKMRLANLEGYITCQQTNKAFENPDSSWYFHREGFQKEGKTPNKVPLIDTEYRDSVIAIMEQAREEFLAVVNNPGYHKGAVSGILSDILNENASYFL